MIISTSRSHKSPLLPGIGQSCHCLDPRFASTVANGNKARPLCYGALYLEVQITMSLTEKMILDRSKAKNLTAVRNLNVWGCRLTDISLVTKLPQLEVLNLR